MAVERESLGNKLGLSRDSVGAGRVDRGHSGNERTLIGPVRVMIIPSATNEVRVYVISLTSHLIHV